MTVAPPDTPAGPFQPHEQFDQSVKSTLIDSLGQAPAALRDAVAGLTDAKLDTRYKNWTVRQIVHHIADSHVHSYIRFKWALTEPNPLIKAYAEGDWVLLQDAEHGHPEPALALVDGLHAKWIQVLNAMSREEFDRTFRHPQSGETVSLWEALNYYAWHSQHHTAQIQWLRAHHNWASPET